MLNLPHTLRKTAAQNNKNIIVAPSPGGNRLVFVIAKYAPNHHNSTRYSRSAFVPKMMISFDVTTDEEWL